MSTVILEIVRVDALQRNDVRPACTCAVARVPMHSLSQSPHAAVQTRARTRKRVSAMFPHGAVRNVRCSETIVAMVKGTGNTPARHLISTGRQKKGTKRARDLLTSPVTKGSCCSTFQNASRRFFVELRSWDDRFALSLGNLRWKRRNGAPRRLNFAGETTNCAGIL